jgi:hypothetical protein
MFERIEEIVSEQEYAIEFIAGGVVKDKDGNVIDESSERAAQAKLKALGLTNILVEEE